MRTQEKTTIVSTEQLTEDIFRFAVLAPQIADKALPGQFVMVKTGSSLDPLLRRPFSVHDVQGDLLYLLFKVVGKGTGLMSGLGPGDSVDLLGPLGNSFKYQQDTAACLVGGGMGIAPLLFYARVLRETVKDSTKHSILLGAQSREELEPLARDFEALGYSVLAATNDGSYGHHGFVTSLLDGAMTAQTTVYMCGPEPMMAAVAQQCLERGVACQASLETHMACGLGACLGCTVHGADGEYRHVCKHGPVFNASEVVWTI